MSLEIKPLAEITHEALDILCRHLGVANTARFVNQFTTGYGNYTEDRRKLFAQMSLEEIVTEIEQGRKRD